MLLHIRFEEMNFAEEQIGDLIGTRWYIIFR